MNPELAMRQALTRARRVLGRTWPNPAVGAVVFRAGRVLGGGATRPPGGPHAEIAALSSVRRRLGARALRGASVSVTLEPCSHTGQTGPCTEALIEAGVKRVYVGCCDPNPAHPGGGLRKLRAAGIRVTEGVLAAECREQHRGFLSLCERGRPFVTLKLAATLDGRIATSAGESRWITGPAAREVVHRLRRRVDAVMVGSGTVLADDPELTARRAGRIVRRPVRVLVDGRLRVSPEAKIFVHAPEAQTLVLCRVGARGRAARRAAGARLLELRDAGRGQLDLRSGLRALGKVGLTTILVEGGSGLAAALLRARLVDEIHWFLAPSLLGGDGRAALDAFGVNRLRDGLTLERVRVRKLGPDIEVTGRVEGAWT